MVKNWPLYRTIATVFSIDNNQSVGHYCEQVRNSLLKGFVPKNLGVAHLSRDDWVKETTIFAKTLYNATDNELILVADGTYLYHKKVAIMNYSENLIVFKKVDIFPNRLSYVLQMVGLLMYMAYFLQLITML